VKYVDAILGYWGGVFEKLGPLELLLGVMMFAGAWVLYQAHKGPSNFNLRHLIADPVTDKVVLEKAASLGAFLVSSWGFIALIHYKLMSEWYFVGYMVAWAGARPLTMYMAKKGDANGPQTP